MPQGSGNYKVTDGNSLELLGNTTREKCTAYAQANSTVTSCVVQEWDNEDHCWYAIEWWFGGKITKRYPEQAIRQAIDRGGGHSVKVQGVLNALDKAGFEIVRKQQ